MNINYFANVSRLTKMLHLTNEAEVYKACKEIFGDDVWVLNLIHTYDLSDASIYNVPPPDSERLKSMGFNVVTDTPPRWSMRPSDIHTIGEQLVIHAIRKIRPEFIIPNTCFNETARFVIEIKNKHPITDYDINTFKRSLTAAKGIGLFISLETDTLPGMGPFDIQDNPLAVYMTKAFFNPTFLNSIFDYTPIINAVSR